MSQPNLQKIKLSDPFVCTVASFEAGEYNKRKIKDLGRLWAVGLTSAVFAFLHVTAAAGPADFIWRFLYSFILAVLLCQFRHQTGNLSASVVFHGVWNFVFMGLLSLETEESPTALVSYAAESPMYQAIPLALCVILWALLFWKRNTSILSLPKGSSD